MKSNFVDRVKSINRDLSSGKQMSMIERHISLSKYDEVFSYAGEWDNHLFGTKSFYDYYDHRGYQFKTFSACEPCLSEGCHSKICPFQPDENVYFVTNPFFSEPHCHPYFVMSYPLETVHKKLFRNSMEETMHQEIFDSIEPLKEAKFVADEVIQKSNKILMQQFISAYKGRPKESERSFSI